MEAAVSERDRRVNGHGGAWIQTRAPEFLDLKAEAPAVFPKTQGKGGHPSFAVHQRDS
jgi:hypothetical protein